MALGPYCTVIARDWPVHVLGDVRLMCHGFDKNLLSRGGAITCRECLQLLPFVPLLLNGVLDAMDAGLST